MRPPRLWRLCRLWWRHSARLRDLVEVVTIFAAVEVAWVGVVAGLLVLLEATATVLCRAIGGA